MNQDELCKCRTLTLGRYVDGDSPEWDYSVASALAKAFCLWFEKDSFDPSTGWLTIKLSYSLESIYAPDLLATIKFFALYSGFSIMHHADELKPALDGIEEEHSQE